MRVLKGSIKNKEIFIASYLQHSKRGTGAEGPIRVKSQEGYIFFLTSKQKNLDQYLMFDEHDGVIQPNGPVTLEIRNQLKKKNK